MEASSPRRNLEPLLDGEQAPAAGAYAAYAPPVQPIQTPVMPISAAGTAVLPPALQEPYDLNFTITDESTNGAGEIMVMVVPPPPEEELPQLPPLISYCSYVKYACTFGKWLLLVLIVNIVAFAIPASDDYFNGSILAFDSWKGGMLAGVWLGTAVWLYISAKVVERDVQHVDHIAQYEQGRLSEEPENGISNLNQTQTFVPNCDNVYGQVSRKIDAMFTSKSATRQMHPQHPQAAAAGISSLANLSYALWALFLGGGVFLGTGTLLGKHYVSECDGITNLPNATDSGSKKDFQDVSQFPDDIQQWITEKKDPWSYPRHYEYDDDFHEDYNMAVYDFPTAYETDFGLFAAMKDDTVFFSAKSLPEENHDGSSSNHLVLVESMSNGTIKYHDDIVNPRMFIPVESTMSTDSSGTPTASQYCFTAAKQFKKGNRQRNWDVVIRTTPIHCIITSGDGTISIQKATIGWKDKSRQNPKLSAAASGSVILMAHIGNDDRNTYQEIVAVNPSTMEFKTVYHLTTLSEMEYDSRDRKRNSNQRRCIQKHVIGFSAFSGLVVLVASSVWLIFREGVPSGVVPLIYAIVSLLFGLLGGGRWENLSLTIGIVFLHAVFCCDNGRACHLPAWIGQDMYVSALYGWLSAFAIMDLVAGYGDVFILALVLLALTGLFLDHPVLHLMGWVFVAVGVIWLMLWPFFGGYIYDLIPIALSVLIGFGMMAFANCVSRNRSLMSAFCRPMSRAFGAMFYGDYVSQTAPTQVPVS